MPWRPRRHQRPPGRIDPKVESVSGVVDKRAFRWDDNILRHRSRVIHDDLVESGHEKVHDPIFLDLDFIRKDCMVHRVPWLGGI